MAYLHTLDGWHDLQILFEDNNLKLDTDTVGEPVFYDNEGDQIEWEDLPQEIQQALTVFENKHSLNTPEQ